MKTHCKNGHLLAAGNRTKPSANRPTGRCKLCLYAHNKRWNKNNPDKIRKSAREYTRRLAKEDPKYWLRSKYHMSAETYEAMRVEQDNRCAVCKVVFDENVSPCVDHDHSCCAGKHACGKCNRGLVCGECNKGLGNFKDHPEVLEAAARYIRTRSQKQ